MDITLVENLLIALLVALVLAQYLLVGRDKGIWRKKKKREERDISKQVDQVREVE